MILSWIYTSGDGFIRECATRHLEIPGLTFPSDQLVTLTTTTPPTRVRITGITADHGLLRTVPERTGWSSGETGFIDLQPDGNSFDIMGGLIKTKTQS